MRSSWDDPLAGVEIKLARAREHLQELESQIAAFGEGKPWSVVVEFDQATGEHVGRLHVLRQPPLELGVIAGEALGQCRSSLDHAMSAMIRRAGHSDSGNFPIFRAASGEDGWADSKYGRRLYQKLLARDQLALVQREQPYHLKSRASSHWLCLLQEFTNADKHKVVIPTFTGIAALGRPPGRLDWPGVKRIRFPWMSTGLGNMDDGAELYRVIFEPETDVYVPMIPSIGIDFRLESGLIINTGWIELAIDGAGSLVVEMRAVTPGFRP